MLKRLFLVALLLTIFILPTPSHAATDGNQYATCADNTLTIGFPYDPLGPKTAKKHYSLYIDNTKNGWNKDNLLPGDKIASQIDNNKELKLPGNGTMLYTQPAGTSDHYKWWTEITYVYDNGEKIVHRDLYGDVLCKQGADLVITSFGMEDDNGDRRIPPSFSPNHDIYFNFTIRNNGDSPAISQSTSDKNIWAQIYMNKPDTVTPNTKSDIGVWIKIKNNIKPGEEVTYSSRSGGKNNAAFEGKKNMRISQLGSYTARLFLNYDRLAKEKDYTNNQRTIEYAILPTSTPVPTAAPTKAPIPTPTTAAPTPTDTPQAPKATAVCKDGKLTFSLEGSTSQKWAIRVDDLSNPWNDTIPNSGDIIDNNFAGNTYVYNNVVPGKWYAWWVHTINAQGVYSPSTGSYLQCPEPSLGKPTNLHHSYEDSKVTLQWDPVPGAKYYSIRVDNMENPWTGDPNNINPGDQQRDKISVTSYTFGAPRNRALSWWLHAVSEAGQWSDSTGEFFVTPN